MKTKLGILLVLLAAAFARAQTTNLTALLQQGLFEEQANRNLPAAISDYQALANQFDTDRQIAATAIFRLGECYRMENKTNEAAQEYQRIIGDFSDQKTLVTLSRQNLTGMGMTSGNPADQLTSAALSETFASSPPQSAELWDKVKNLSRADLEKVLPMLAPDPVLTSLLQKRDEAETKLSSLSIYYSTNFPDYKAQQAVLDEINRQISGKIDGIMEVLKLNAQEANSTLAQNKGSGSAPTDAEDQEIQRIQQMIQNSPDLINASSDGTTPLVQAAYNGWLKVAAYLLNHGADVNVPCWKIPGTLTRFQGNNTPLIAAVAAGNKAMTQFLIDHGANVNFTGHDGMTPLALAASKGFQAVAESLLAAHADVNPADTSGNTPLFCAVQSGQLKMVQIFLAAGADVNHMDASGRTVLNLAVGASPETMQTLLNAGANPNTKDSLGRTPLSYAMERGATEEVKLLLAAKADPNAGTLDAPLLRAIYNGDTTSAELLLLAGANPNVKGEVDWQEHSFDFKYEERSNFGPVGRGWATPLWQAISMNQLPMVQLLLKYKADPNDTQIENQSLLFDALQYTNILASLLDAGAKVDPADNLANRRASPLELAASANNVSAMEILLNHGANPNYRDPYGYAPLIYAVSNIPHREAIGLLLDHHADPNVRNIGGNTPLDILKQRAGNNNSAQDERERAAQLADYLRQRGALDVLPDWDHITVSRPYAHYSQTIPGWGTNNWNQFTLFDLLGVQYDLLSAYPSGHGQGNMSRSYSSLAPNQNNLAFPDFSRIIIHRPSPVGTNWTDLKINLAQALDTGDSAADVPLKFGDVVEIPESDHVLYARWMGLSTNQLFTLKNGLTRHLQLTVNGVTTNLVLAPDVELVQPGTQDAFGRRFGGGAGGNAISMIEHEPLMIWPVLENSQLLLASSDLSRVQVKRRDAGGKLREWTVDCSNPNSPPDFWLRDGDEIVVPEQP